MIYLDNAATSFPKPESVYRAADTFMRSQSGNPGRASHQLAMKAQRVVDTTRLSAARFINAPEVNRVIFTLNCTQAINFALKGILKPGDNVVTDRLGHNALVRPLHKLEKKGVTISWVDPIPGTYIVSPASLERAITPTTRLIAMTHGSNVNGVVQPIAEYGLIARKHGIPLLIDAAQTVGKLPIDVVSNHIDLLAFSGHKGLLGPQGTGALYVGEAIELDTLIEGGTGTQSDSEEQPTELPYRFESGTMNGVGIAGLGAGIEYILSEGLDSVQSREQELTRALIDGFSNIPRVKIYSADSSEQLPVFSINIEGYDPGEVGAILDQAFGIQVRTGLHCAPTAHRLLGTYPKGTVRFSPGYFTSDKEIEFTVQAVRKIAGQNL